MRNQVIKHLKFIIIIPLLLFSCDNTMDQMVNGVGEGKSSNITVISTAEELNNIRNDLDGHYVLTRDVDLSGVQWLPVGGHADDTQFTGTFDGNGHNITGLVVNGSTYVGFFGETNGATIKNVNIVNGNVTGTENASNVSLVGGLIANATRTTIVENCSFSGSVRALGDYVGGLIGGNYTGSTVKNCYSTGTVSGRNRVGGLVGSNQHPSVAITNCYSICSVQTGSYHGGLVGYNYLGASNTNSYFIDSSPDNGYGSPLSLAQMKDQANYNTWNFSTIWNIDGTTNGGYPFLR